MFSTATFRNKLQGTYGGIGKSIYLISAIIEDLSQKGENGLVVLEKNYSWMNGSVHGSTSFDEFVGGGGIAEECVKGEEQKLYLLQREWLVPRPYKILY